MRPGGLTALAIFNFIFGGLSAIFNLISLATISAMYDEMARQAERQGDQMPSELTLYLLGGFALVRAGLLIASGVGYLQVKKFLGRGIGNTYAGLALIAIAVEISLAPQNFAIINLIEFVYPLITLYLLNVIFRKDFVR